MKHLFSPCSKSEVLEVLSLLIIPKDRGLKASRLTLERGTTAGKWQSEGSSPTTVSALNHSSVSTRPRDFLRKPEMRFPHQSYTKTKICCDGKSENSN